MEALRAHWRECGPPVHIAIAHISSAYLGLKLTSEPKREKVAAPVDLGTINLSGMPQPVAGGDTLAASMAILAKLQEMHGG